MTYLGREIAPAVASALRQMPVVVLTGARQVGKSTMLTRDPALSARRTLTLDAFPLLEAARNDPDGLLGDDDVTIDEAQRAPELVLAIKRAVDRERRPGRFLLSGSATFGLMERVADSLAGRSVAFSLHPFDRRERLGRARRRPWLAELLEEPRVPRTAAPPVATEEILRGGFPSLVVEPHLDRALWFRGYEQTYLERDVRALTQVADLVAFRDLLRLVALRTGQILNISDLARDAKLSVTTARRYLAVLEASFVVRRLAPFLSSRVSRLVKSPKIYVADAGLAAHLTAVDDLGPTADEPMRGALFETWVAQNLAAILEAHVPRARLGYWHVQGRHEVDFVIELGRDLFALEVKASARWRPRDLDGLQAFLAAHPRCKAAVLVHNGETAVSLGDRLWAIPMSQLLS